MPLIFALKGMNLSAYDHRGEQLHIMCSMEELMPSIGTSVPSPSVLAVTISQSESTLQNVAKLYSDAAKSPLTDLEFDNPFDFCDDILLLYKTHVISISDDGKIWNWLLTVEGSGDTQKDNTDVGEVSDVPEMPLTPSADGLPLEAGKQHDNANSHRSRPSSVSRQDGILYKVNEINIVK